MEKVKSVFSSIATWIKKHWIVAVVVLAVVIVAIVLVNFVLGTEKRAIKKYLSALNTCDVDKIVKAMDVKANLAWKQANSSSYDYSSIYGGDSDEKKDDKDVVEEFKDALDEVEDDDIDEYKDSLDDQYDKDDKGKVKYKLLKVVSVTKAKDSKDLKKVVCKVRAVAKPDKDDDDDEDSIWKKEKKYTVTEDRYLTFYLYKNKVFSGSL